MVIEVKKIFEENGLTKYLIKGVDSVFMNSIRRITMNAVPCLAIDTVNIYSNDSVINDEMLAHRLAMLPIKTDVKGYKKGQSVKLVLEAEGPCMVTSKDIKSTDPKVEILEKEIPIVKLGKGEKLKLEMSAMMGVGKEHVKFQPGIIAYNQAPNINNEKSYKIREILSEFPKGIIDEKAGKLFLVDPYNLKNSSQHEDLMKKFGIELEYSDDEFVLTIESTGQLDADEIVESAVDVLKEKLDTLAEEVKKL